MDGKDVLDRRGQSLNSLSRSPSDYLRTIIVIVLRGSAASVRGDFAGIQLGFSEVAIKIGLQLGLGTKGSPRQFTATI